MKTDFKQEAIKINDELIGVLSALLSYLQLIRETYPPKAMEVVRDDFDAHMKKFETRLTLVKARKQKLENEEV